MKEVIKKTVGEVSGKHWPADTNITPHDLKTCRTSLVLSVGLIHLFLTTVF